MSDVKGMSAEKDVRSGDAGKSAKSDRSARFIGIKTSLPSQQCDDKNCPYHGNLSVRGRLFDGRVTGAKARKTATLQKDIPIYFSKFKRYARGKSTIHAHIPGCIEVQNGDSVLAAECRPISKSVSYVIVEVHK